MYEDAFNPTKISGRSNGCCVSLAHWHSVFRDLGTKINFYAMGYLLIKKDDVKTFKSFLSGNEIEVGVRIGSGANLFNPNEEVYVFYGNDDSDTYKARIKKQKRTTESPSDQSFVTLVLVKEGQRSQQ